MKIIRALLLLTSLGAMAFAITIIQTKTKNSYLADNLGPMIFAGFDTSLGKLTGVSVGFSFLKTGRLLDVDHDVTLGGAIFSRHDVEAYIATSTINIASFTIDNTASALRSASVTVGGNHGDDAHMFDVATSDNSECYAATINTTFATENIDSDSWANYVGTGNYDIDYTRNNQCAGFGAKAGGLCFLV
ncbi:MAG: hypothetical protein WCS43_00795 [Verrucomicrobiota bacterium]